MRVFVNTPKRSSMKVDKANIGRTATIINTAFEDHRTMVGKVGVIVRAVKTRNVYEIRLPEGKLWTSFPENVRLDPTLRT